MRKKTHEEYVAELAIKNPTVEVVGTYVNAKTKIMHHCLIHDVYWDITPDNALHGAGCEMCRKEKISEFNSKTSNQYVLELKECNKNVIALEPYVDAKTPILHKCLIHDVEWKAIPDNILHGAGCPKCKSEKISNKIHKTHKQYVDELKLINPNIIPIETYKYSLTPILHKCLIDGNEWYVTPANTLSGCGCPRCSKSKGEEQICKLLDNVNVYYERQKTFDDCKDIKPLPFDFYLPNYNCCIEYDGEQHYRAVDYFGGEEYFRYVIKHDNIKNDYCKNNNIKLLRIPYYANVEEELNNFLFI